MRRIPLSLVLILALLASTIPAALARGPATLPALPEVAAASEALAPVGRAPEPGAASSEVVLSAGQPTVYLYYQDFSTSGSFAAGGTNSTWAWGAPSGVGNPGTHSSPYVWATNLSGDYNASEDSYATSPNIDLSAYPSLGLTLRWWQWRQTESCCDSVGVEISSDGGANWNPIYGPAYGNSTGWEQITYQMAPAYSTNVFRIRFHLVSDGANQLLGYYIDDITVETGPDFSTSRKVAPSQVAPGSPITYTITITNSGNTAANGARMTDTIPAGVTYRAGSLSCTAGSCSYETPNNRIRWTGNVPIGGGVQVRFAVDTGSFCGFVYNTAIMNHAGLTGGPVTRWAGTRVTTLTPGFEEGFDGADFPPAGWATGVVTSGAVLPAWARVSASTVPPISPHRGAAMAQFNSSQATANSSAHLDTPVMDLSPLAAPRLLFWMSHNTSAATNYDRLQLLISTDGGTSWTNLGEPLYRYDSACVSPCWKQHSVDLSAHRVANVRLRFLGISQDGQNITLDDITVDEAWYPCAEVLVQPAAHTAGTCRGSTLTHVLTVQNANSTADTVTFSAAGNTWPVTFNPTSLSLGPGQSDTVDVAVYVPWNAASPGADTATITALAQGSGLSGQAQLTSHTGPNDGYADYAPLSYYRRTRDHSLVYYNGKLFKFGGYDNNGAAGGARDYTYIYDLATNTWSNGAPMPGVRYWIDCVEIGGLIYCAGGYSASGQTTLYIYNPASNTWSTGAALPAYRYAYAGVALGGKYYVIGGRISGGPTNTMLVYDPGTNSWASGVSMTIARRYPSAGVIGGKIYVAGGCIDDSCTPLSRVTEVYDPATTSWSTFAQLPATDPEGDAITGWERAADGVIGDRYLVMAGGYAADSAPSSFALAYDQVQDQWSWLTFLDHSLYSAAGDTDGSGNFWFASGRIPENPYNYSRYLTRMGPWCGSCQAPSDVGFTYDPAAPYIGETVIFTGTAASASPISYTWALGDGNLASGQVITHSYSVSDTFTVVLTATNCDGLAHTTVADTITVLGRPLVAITPTGLLAQQCPDTVTTQTLSICNDGSTALHWNLEELPGLLVRTGTLDSGVPQDTLPWADRPGTAADVPWLSEDPTSGAVGAGACTPVTVAFDSTSLGPGDYFASLLLASDDPGTPVITVPVTLTVDMPPDLVVTAPPLEAGLCPDEFDSLSLGLCNAGECSLVWSLTDTATWLTVDPPTGSLGMGECEMVGVYFDAFGLTPGDYLAGLTISSNDPALPTLTLPVTLTVLEPAVAGFERSTPVCLGQPAVFTNTSTGSEPLTFLWGFGDGDISTEPNPSHIYTAPGTYEVLLTAMNECAASEARHDVVVNPVPAASFDYDPPAGHAPLTVYFTDTSQYASNPTWAFGDGETGSGRTVQHTYSAAGDYTVTLTVQSPLDCGTDMATAPVHVALPGVPVAGFTSSSPDCPGETTSFTNTTVGTGTITYEWAFGDGGTSTDVNPTHLYAAPGTYTVILTATNAAGSDSIRHPVVIVAEPSGADFTWSPTSPDVGVTVYFTGAVSAGTEPLTYAWAFGDGSMGSGTNPTHAYAAAGTYEVVMTVTNACGEDVATHMLTVVGGCTAPYNVAFTWNPPTPLVGENVTFAGTAEGTPPIAFAWAFGDGSTGSGATAVHSYAAPGDYSVTMTSTNSCGEQFVLHTVTVVSGCVAPAGADFSWLPVNPVAGQVVGFDATLDAGTSPLTYTWAFGDGGTGSGQEASHIYLLAGPYTVTLGVANPCGEDTVALPVVVAEVPAPGYFIYLPIVVKGF